MRFSKSNLNQTTQEKREYLEELYRLVKTSSDRKNAYFDVEINAENPKDSKLIANRPGVELFAVELMKEMEEHYDETADVLYEVLPIRVGKWCKKTANVHFTEMEVRDFEKYKNSFRHNDTRDFWEGLYGSFIVYFRIAVYILAMFGGVAVLRFCATKF